MDDTSRRYYQLRETAHYLQQTVGYIPKVAIILGSGLGALADMLEFPISLSYSEIPGFAAATVQGHSGRLVCGLLDGEEICAMQGRFHYYEGHDMATVVFPVQAFATWGIPNLIVTNACGGINLTYKVGDLMLIRDLITLFCPSPMRGENMAELGERFFDMTTPLSEEFMEMARHSALEAGITLREGIYAYAQGPHFETPVDIRLLRLLGADVVGMSTVPEIIAARHAGMQIIGISSVTNMAAGVMNKPLDHQEVLQAGIDGAERFAQLIRGIVARM
ncbi:MAG: purine-nucleoside phosphorylase [Symbiobacteriaceae bacterium]|nr:purine-nucleoside phosphorylase [Symbiobacteriaceae bacterium]